MYGSLPRRIRVGLSSVRGLMCLDVMSIRIRLESAHSRAHHFQYRIRSCCVAFTLSYIFDTSVAIRDVLFKRITSVSRTWFFKLLHDAGQPGDVEVRRGGPELLGVRRWRRGPQSAEYHVTSPVANDVATI